LGNLGGGAGVLTTPMIYNWDTTMSKFIPLFHEKVSLRLQAQAYNVFNHTEYIGVNTGIQWTAAGVLSNPGAVGNFNATLPARVMAFSARITF
jgi:hypothetical protein